MSDTPLTAAALRGAVDLSALKRPAGGGQRGPSGGAPAGPATSAGWTAAARAGMPGGGGSSGGGAAGAAGATAADDVVVAVTDATFEHIANASIRVPVVMVFYSGRVPESGSFVGVLAELCRSNDGRFQVASVDVDTSPGLLRALQVQSVPATIGLIQAQPVPLFLGALSAAEVQPWLDELLKLAVQHGVTGRVELPAGTGAEAEADESLPPLHQEAFDAIERGELDAAATAYEKALAENPADTEAQLGLGQVRLLQRTKGVDLHAARAAAAATPDDIPAQLLVADLDVLGGHVEDAFGRLIDVVRRTAGSERDQARTHLLGLFDIVGAQDPRVTAARKALMSALF